MASKQAIQIMELKARNAIRAALGRLADHAGTAITEPPAGGYNDPVWRAAVELQALAESLTAVAVAVCGPEIEAEPEPPAEPDPVQTGDPEPEAEPEPVIVEVDPETAAAISADLKAQHTRDELADMAGRLGIEVKASMNKQEIVDAILASGLING